MLVWYLFPEVFTFLCFAAFSKPSQLLPFFTSIYVPHPWFVLPSYSFHLVLSSVLRNFQRLSSCLLHFLSSSPFFRRFSLFHSFSKTKQHTIPLVNSFLYQPTSGIWMKITGICGSSSFQVFPVSDTSKKSLGAHCGR